MVQTHITEQKPDSLLIQADALSHLAFVNLSTICSINNHQCQDNGKFYFHDSFENRKDYFEITDELKRLSKETEITDLLPFATMSVVEFTISQNYLTTLIKKLAQQPLHELQDLAMSLKNTANLDITYSKPSPIINSHININYNPTQVSVLDMDSSIENKIIFYHLYQANNDDVEKITEKIELMTMEQRENFIEQIFQISPLQKLPKIIYNHLFCTLKIITSYSEIKPLCEQAGFKLILQKPVHHFGHSTPEQIKSSSNHETYLVLMEKIKKHLEQTPNPYILPGTFNQQVILALDLQSIEELNKMEIPLKAKIFRLLIKHEPFLKSLIKQQS